MRRLAMDELDDDDDTASSITEGASSVDDEPRSRKRNGQDQSVSTRKKKLTKRERLSVVTDSLADALNTTKEDERGAYEYKIKRLDFEHEEAERKRMHESPSEMKKLTDKESTRAKRPLSRRAHEADIEKRRLKAEKEREKMMYEFFT